MRADAAAATADVLATLAYTSVLEALPTVALSIQQPWAWLIVHGYKDVENRTWGTLLRGRIFVHAGLKVDKGAYPWIRARFPEVPLPPHYELPVGGLVGAVEITGCSDRSPSPWHALGQHAFALAAPWVLPFVRMKGRLGFFPVPDDVRSALALRLLEES